MANNEGLCAFTALACAAVGAVTDLKSRRIPNLLTGPAFLLGVSLHLALAGYRGLGSAIAAALVCGSVFLMFYLAGGMGAGDVKLIACVASLLGLRTSGMLLISTALSGGLLALALALLRGRLRETVMNVGDLVVHHRKQGLQPHPDLNVGNPGTLRLPYALAITMGTAFSCFVIYTQG